MLRAVFLPDGTQKVLPAAEPYAFRVYELGGEENAGSIMTKIRREMSSQMLPADVWPLFDIRAARYGERGKERLRLFLDFDAMIADAWSIFLLLEEWRKLYAEPETELRPLSLSFRDYVLAEEKLEGSERRRRDFEYWKARLDTLPPAPELPLARQPGELSCARTIRFASSLEPGVWTALQARIRDLGLSASSVLAAVYAEVIGRWSASPRFTLNLTVFNRLPLHPEVNDIVGDFSSVELLEVDMDAEASFLGRVRRIQSRLWEDMSHRTVSGVRVLRELAAAGRPMRMPVVFTGAAGFGAAGRDASSFSGLGTLVTSLTQTPQVWLDHQTFEQDGALMLNWDVVEGLFPEGMVEEMFCAYVDLLQRLSSDAELWTRQSVMTLSDAQLRARALYNDTAWETPAGTLASLVRRAAAEHADRPAVITPDLTLTHGELYRRACAVAGRLAQAGVKRGDLVGIVMDKGWEQVAAAEGVVAASVLFVDEPGLEKRLRGILLTRKNGLESVPAVGRKAEREASRRLPADLPPLEILDRRRALPKILRVEVRRLLHVVGERLRAFDGGASRGREALLGHFHAVNRGKASNGLRIVEVFVLHQKSDGIPRLSAAEALEALPRGTHRKGRRLLLVKRAARHEVPPRLLERNAAADHVDDVGAVEQIRNEAVRNHGKAVPFGRKAPKRRRKL